LQIISDPLCRWILGGYIAGKNSIRYDAFVSYDLLFQKFKRKTTHHIAIAMNAKGEGLPESAGFRKDMADHVQWDPGLQQKWSEYLDPVSRRWKHRMTNKGESARHKALLIWWSQASPGASAPGVPEGGPSGKKCRTMEGMQRIQK
jgi:hypothetical protein